MLHEEYQPRRRLPLHLRPQPAPEAAFAYELRDARAEDLPAVREIYNHYVRNSTVTFDERPTTLAELRRKFERVAALGLPFVVAESPTGHVLGYAYVYPWREKAAYRHTVENSIYLSPAATGKGLGRVLLEALLERSRQAGIREVIAVIADQGADASLAIHREFGFSEVGRMGRVGFKFGRWLGTILLQKSLR